MSETSNGQNMLKLIYVVDDTSEIREGIATILREIGGYIVECFSNPDDADLAISEMMPDLIFTDFNMPGFRNGVEFRHDILRTYGVDSVPVVMASGHSRYEIWSVSKHLFPQGSDCNVELSRFPLLRKPMLSHEILNVARMQIEDHERGRQQQLAATAVPT